MEHPHFFGYGSLVNRETHDFTPVHAARIRGWQRIWQRAPKRPVAFLSVIRDRDATIEGVIAPVPNDDWQTLDAREFSYDRVLVTDTVAHTATSVRDVSIYAIPSRSGSLRTRIIPFCSAMSTRCFRAFCGNLAKTAQHASSQQPWAGMRRSATTGPTRFTHARGACWFRKPNLSTARWRISAFGS